MSPPSSARLAAALALVVLAAGCLGGAPAGTPTATPTHTQTQTATPTPTPTASPTPTPTTATGTASGWEYASDQPEPHHSVVLTNAWNRSVELRVTVVREATNETVREGTCDLEPGSERTVYDTAEVNPDGVETFAVTATTRNTTESVTIETSQCYENAYVEIERDGDLFVTYAIC